jgi:hypothetical protein
VRIKLHTVIQTTMCFSVFASASAFGTGIAACLISWYIVEHKGLPDDVRNLYLYALGAWGFATCMQLADLTSWLTINHGGEKPWNGILSFVLNVGQIYAMFLALWLASGRIAPAVAVIMVLYTVAAVYIGTTTELRVSPQKPGGHLVYTWWKYAKGNVFAALYMAAMAIIMFQFPDPLRLASYIAVALTLVASWVGTGLSKYGEQTASVWCWLAAIVGPACVVVAAARA